MKACDFFAAETLVYKVHSIHFFLVVIILSLPSFLSVYPSAIGRLLHFDSLSALLVYFAQQILQSVDETIKDREKQKVRFLIHFC